MWLICSIVFVYKEKGDDYDKCNISITFVFSILSTTLSIIVRLVNGTLYDLILLDSYLSVSSFILFFDNNSAISRFWVACHTYIITRIEPPVPNL